MLKVLLISRCFNKRLKRVIFVLQLKTFVYDVTKRKLTRAKFNQSDLVLRDNASARSGLNLRMRLFFKRK